MKHYSWRILCSVLLVVGVIGMSSLAWAGEASPESTYARGVEAFKQGEVERAIGLLEEIVYEDPGLQTEELGSAAYWLGQAYEAGELENRAQQVWRLGLLAMQQDGNVDVPLMDVFVRRVFGARNTSNYMLGTQAYLLAVRELNEHLEAPSRDILVEHLRALAAVIPKHVQERTGLKHSDDVRKPDWTLAEDAGEVLEAWWRSQDELPATRANERLHEHLERFARAYDNFQSEGALDARALVYIRLGEQARTSEVRFDSPRFRDKVVQRVTGVTFSDFPRNEIWVYHHIDHAVHYLFVKKENRYVVGEVEDLIPSSLRRGLGLSQRGTDRAASLIWAMEEIYRHLSIMHSDYGTRYADLTDFATMMDMQEAVGGTYDLTGRDLPQPPSSFAQNMLSQQSYEDGLIRQRREEAVPESRSEVLDAYDELPVDVRLARFLEEDGTTRTELYWNTTATALVPSDAMLRRIGLDRANVPEDYYIETTVVQRTEGYRDRVISEAQHVARDLTEEHETPGRERVVGPETYVVSGDSGRYHLAVQWDGHLAVDQRPDDRVQVGPRVHVGAFRADLLDALRAENDRLEMSDLKPLDMRDEEVFLEEAPPYPYASLTSDIPLALYFEVYHLFFDEDDRTRYEVEYEVVRVRERGAIARLVLEDDEERTVTQATYEADGRRAGEYIMLDLSEHEGEGTLRVNVRVTDQMTGEQVARSIGFVMEEDR